MILERCKPFGCLLLLATSFVLTGCGQPAADLAPAENETSAENPIAVENSAFFKMWSSTMTIPNDDRWLIEDLACFLGCVDASYPYLAGLFDDPANDERSFDELAGEAWALGAEHLESILTEEGAALRARLAENEDASAIACEPLGLFRTVMSPLPYVWTQNDDTIEIMYEEWAVTRTIFMDDRDHPVGIEPSLYGHSIGHFEGDDLVIDSIGILPEDYYPHLGGGGHGDQVSMVERYTPSEDGERLDLTVTLTDPEMLTEPLVFVKAILNTPDVELLDHSCEFISGER